MATLEMVVIIVAIIIFAAIFVPILLDDGGVGFIPNSLCIIFGNVAGNYTCNDTVSNVTFTGLNGITIIPSNGSTIFWNFTGTQVNGSAIMQFHNLGGDAGVFSHSGIFDSYWRGISEGIGINVTERTVDILIALKDCDDKELLVFNGTTGDYECISGADFSSDIAFDNDELMYPWFSGTSSGTHVVLSLTNYDIRALREAGVGATQTTSTWSWPVPHNFDPTSNINFTIYWITQTASAGTVCHDVHTMPVVDGVTIDGAFGTSVQICNANQGSNILTVNEFTLTPAQHQLDPDELGFISLHRDQTDPSDTLSDNVYLIMGKLEWNG